MGIYNRHRMKFRSEEKRPKKHNDRHVLMIYASNFFPGVHLRSTSGLSIVFSPTTYFNPQLKRKDLSSLFKRNSKIRLYS